MNDLYRVSVWVEVIADDEDEAANYVRSVIKSDAEESYSLINDWEVTNLEKVT